MLGKNKKLFQNNKSNVSNAFQNTLSYVDIYSYSNKETMNKEKQEGNHVGINQNGKGKEKINFA
jgi:hypothetical protein